MKKINIIHYSFFPTIITFKLKKYQHNTGTTVCNLCFNFPETYLQSFALNKQHPCHIKVTKSGGRAMRQNTGTSNFFCMISTILTITVDG